MQVQGVNYFKLFVMLRVFWAKIKILPKVFCYPLGSKRLVSRPDWSRFWVQFQSEIEHPVCFKPPVVHRMPLHEQHFWQWNKTCKYYWKRSINYSKKLKVAGNSFQYFRTRTVWWAIITSLYQLMSKSWYQQTVRSPLPEASICAVPLSQPFPIKNYF